MNFDRKTLLQPPFAENPPIRIDVDASLVGGGLAILAAIAIIGEVQSILYVLGVLTLSGSFLWALVVFLIELGGEALILFGAIKMFQRAPRGKELVIYGLAIDLVGHILPYVYFSLVMALESVVLIIALYYITVIARFKEAPAA